MKQPRITFIGSGNMAEALLKGMLTAELCTPAETCMADVNVARLDILASAYGVQTASDNATAVAEADIIFLAVKPQQMDAVLADIKEAADDALIISIAAGIPTQRIENALNGSPRVVRVMPNTPALVGCGASALAGGTHAGPEDLQQAAALLAAVGITVTVSEDLMDAVTALSGSGPAYVFYLIEHMEKAAAALGMDAATARALILQTVTGAAKLMQDTGEEAATLRAKVTSKGGTTEAALKHLESGDVGQSLIDAVCAAQQRSCELSSL